MQTVHILNIRGLLEIHNTQDNLGGKKFITSCVRYYINLIVMDRLIMVLNAHNH